MIMRKEYDLKKLKVKRRGLLPELQNEKRKPAKVRITRSLAQDIVDYFKQSAEGVDSLALSSPDKSGVTSDHRKKPKG